MRTIIPGLTVLGLLAAPALAQAPDGNPQPSCDMCAGVYVPAEEIAAYTKKAQTETQNRPAGSRYRYRQGPHRAGRGAPRQAG